MKRALVLAGGGSRGAFECGAVDFLVNEAGLDFDIFLGSSAGALNAAVLGSARNYRELIKQSRELRELWLNIRGNRSIYQKFGIINFILYDALYNPIGLRRLLSEHVDPAQLCSNPSKFIKIGTVAIETGELFFADSRRPELEPYFRDYILASASIPVYFPPVKIDGKHWYDGGLRDITPLEAAFDERPNGIFVILTFPVNQYLEPILPEVRYRGPFHALLRAFNILTSEISANDLQYARMINEHTRHFPGTRRIPIRIIAPTTALAGDLLEFDPEIIRQNIKKGFEAARNLLIQSKPEISMI